MNANRVGRYFLSVFASLFLAHVSVADEWDLLDDTGSTAPLLVLNTTLQFHGPHTLDVTDTNDWFQVDLSAGIPCQFESTGTLDTRAYLYSDVAGTMEVANDIQGGEFNNFLLRYMPSISGTYYLKVQPHPLGSATGSYTLNYSYYSADAWDFTDNVSTNGTDLTMGEAAKIHGPHVLDEHDYYDWFCVNLSAGVTYRFESIGYSELDDTWGGLYTDPSDPSDEAAVTSNDDTVGLDFQIDYLAPVTGDVYLKVRASYSVEADYDLRYYIPANDSDADQLPDVWEIYYFGSTNAQPNSLSGDSDLQNNLDEYIAGTDPTDGNSFFAVTSYSTGSFVVGWPSIAGREYKVLWAESLTNNFVQQGPTIDHPQNSYTDTAHSAEASGFYKVEVQLK